MPVSIDKKNKKHTFDYLINPDNCAPCKKYKDNKSKDKKSKDKFKTCYSLESLLKIANIWNKNNDSENQITIDIKSPNKEKLWKQLQNKFSKSCDKDESCWKKQEFIKKLKDTEIESFTFKPEYPKEWLSNKYSWLSTYDIQYVMKQYEKIYDDFIFLGPVPADCPISIHCELSNIDLMKLKKDKIHKIGIIYNLDTHTQSGSHWTAIYIDNKNNEINYYDSFGSYPTPFIKKFIEKIVNIYSKNNYKHTLIYNDKRHQHGHSECGVYSMNFVLERMNGKTMYDISRSEIPDEKMNYLRKLLYNYKK